jgi:hypothetical protein
LLFKWAGDWKLSRLFLPLDATQNKQADANKAKHDPVVRELTQAEADNVTTQIVQPAKPEAGATPVPVPERAWPTLAPAALHGLAGEVVYLSADEIGALRAHLAKLWVIPAGAKKPEELVVTVRLRLKQDRTLAGPPVVLTAGSSPLFLASRDSALRALNRAQPFTMLRPEHYEAWKEIEITFDPREKL